MSIIQDFRRSARAHGAPVTVGIVVALIVAFLAVWMSPGGKLAAEFGFASHEAIQKPWTLLIYPLGSLPGDLISLVFACMWLWGIGGQVERDVGSTRYLAAWLTFTLLCAVGPWIGALALGEAAFVWGPWAPIAAITVIWGTRNPTAQILLMFVIPITGKWLAWLSAGVLFFGARPPMMAPFAVLGLFVAYLFASNKIPFAPYFGFHRRGHRGENPAGTRKVYKKEYYDDVKRREKARAEKERLRKLFEESMIEDPDEPK